MSILIIGHNGFIGRHIVNQLTNSFPKLSITGISSQHIDLSTEAGAQAIEKLLLPDTVVIMCAAIKKQLGDTFSIYKKNQQIIENLSAALVNNPVKQVIYFSSAAVYGEDIHNLNIDESTRTNPRSYYGISKLAAEHLLTKVMRANEGSSLAILRPPLVYGIGDTSKGYGPAGFIDKMLTGQNITLWGDGSELREFVYVEDIVRLVCLMIKQNFVGVLNPVSGISHSFQDILTCLSNLVGDKGKIEQNERTKEKVDNVFSAGKLLKHFPDFEFTPLDKGLTKTISLMSEQVS